jgi:2-polyprenyl-3-methyl-5-hydroxy-6-metoxy-1,4-benzoquinol methylase
MQQIGNVADRVREREVMDRPDLDQRLHQQALTGLARLNWLSGSVGLVWPPIAELGSQLGRPLSVLDLATGGGDIPLGLWRRARRTGLDLEICGVDVSSRAVEFARTRAQREGAAVRFVELNALDDELPRNFDVVVCSLFLHHLDRAEAVTLLAKMAAATRHLVLVNDLARSRLGLLTVYFATRVLTTSSVVWVDGPRSVRAAFTLEEARDLARAAGLVGFKISRRWPCRMLLEWTRSTDLPPNQDGASTHEPCDLRFGHSPPSPDH